MENNNLYAVNEGKSQFTVKNVLRVISILCIVFAFCPAFLVSCSGQDVNVSVMTAVKGVSSYGEKIVDPHPVMLICILIPIVILVLLFVKKFADSQTAAIILICSVCDFVVWLIFRNSVKKLADENYCTFETKPGFVLNIIALILIILLTVLVVIKKLQMDSDFLGLVTGKGATQALNRMSSAGSPISSIGNKTSKENAIGFCPKCGSPIAYGGKFCTSCGTPVPESVLAEAEATRKAAETEEEKR